MIVSIKKYCRVTKGFPRAIAFVGLICTLFTCLSTMTMAASMSFKNSSESDHSFKLTLMIDQAEKLAGMKVAITYDKEVFKFIKAEKTKATSSLMHVVNDKVPGKIIIVMAGAKGIDGSDVPLISMFFTRINDKITKENSSIKVIELQLMNEKLKNIESTKPEFHFPFLSGTSHTIEVKRLSKSVV